MAPEEWQLKDENDPTKHASPSEETSHLHAWPETSYFQSLSYSYMNHILNKGQQQFRNEKHLELEDLYAVPPDMEAEQLSNQFWCVLFLQTHLNLSHKSQLSVSQETLQRTSFTVTSFVEDCSKVLLCSSNMGNAVHSRPSGASHGVAETFNCY